jgi:protein gp37
MSDLFHDYVPIEFIKEVFAVMNRETRHQFQVLTKRSKRMAVLAPELTWTPNIWAGVTVEAPEYLPRIDDLRQVPATIRWISAEPLLEALPSVNLTGIHWLVVGGESGPGFRPMNPNWARDLRDQCQRAQVPFFFKQYAHNRRGVKRGAEIDGVMHHAYPV